MIVRLLYVSLSKVGNPVEQAVGVAESAVCSATGERTVGGDGG